MEMIDVPFMTIIFMPLAILFLELSVHGLSVLWRWFINDSF